jgi:hypothetical protein
MPLPQPSSRRVLRHTRAVIVEVFARDDGSWNLDAHIIDVKTRNAKLASGIHLTGQSVHRLNLRVTIDTQLTIVDAEASSNVLSYRDYCDTIGPACKKHIGPNLMKGLRQPLTDRLSGTKGRTHLTGLALALPTNAIQAFASDVSGARDSNNTASANRINSTAVMPCALMVQRSRSITRDGPSRVPRGKPGRNNNTIN